MGCPPPTGRVLVPQSQPMYAQQPYAQTPQGGYAVSSPAPQAPRRGAVPAGPLASPNVAAVPRPASGIIARGQIPEEPAESRREAVALPSPEQLGVLANGGLDMNSVNRRLEGLGATCFQMRQLADGQWHILCLVPTGQPNQTHRIEAQAEAKADAVRLALEQSEQWKVTR